MTVVERLAARLARWLVHAPRQVAVVFGLMMVGSAALLPALRLETGIQAFIAADEPAQVFIREAEKTFVGDDIIFVAYRTDDPFSRQSLEQVRRVGERILAQGSAGESLVEEVVSLTTVKDVRGDEGLFRSVPLVPDEVPEDRASLEAIRAHAKSNWLIREGLLSESDPRVAGLAVRLRRGSDAAAQERAVAEVRAVLAREPPGAEFFLAGSPVIDADATEAMLVDLQRFIPITYVVLSVLIYLFTRRVAGVALAFLNASVAVVFGMGMLAVLGSLTNLSTILPPLLMVLSVATVVHFLVEYARNTQVVGPLHAAEVTLRDLIVPAFMCELTTAVGFLSFGLSKVPAMRHFGFAAAVAVMGVFFTSFLLLALTVRWFGAERLISPSAISANQRLERVVNRYADVAIARPRLMLTVAGVLVLFAVLGLRSLRIDHCTVDEFTGEMPLRRATNLINQHLGGVSELVISVRTAQGERFYAPAELAKLEAFQRFLEREAGVSSTTSVTDHVRLMNRAMLEDAPGTDRVPASREQVAQLVLLNGDDRLFQWIDREWKWARVTARTTEAGSAALNGRFGQIERYLATHFPAEAGYETRITGVTHLDVVMANNILDGQISSLLLSLALIFIPILAAFGAVAGLFTIPTNLFPIVACLGLMGWVGVPLDLATSMTSSIVLGIAVDDTIHFIQGMRHGLAEHGDRERALREALATKGVGAAWITLIITVGFLAVVVSSFTPTFYFGLMTAFAMVAGLLAEFLLLPPLLVLTGTRLGIPAPVTDEARRHR